MSNSNLNAPQMEKMDQSMGTATPDNSSLEGMLNEADIHIEVLTLLYKVCTYFAALVGTVGATSVFMVYNRKHTPNASEIIITLFSATDTIFVLLNLLFLILDRHEKPFLAMNYGLFGFTIMISLLTTNVINVNRYYAISHPTRCKLIFSKYNLKKIILLLVCFSVLQGISCAVYVFVSPRMQMAIDLQFHLTLDILVLVTVVAKVCIYWKCYKTLRENDHKLNSYMHKQSPQSSGTYERKDSTSTAAEMKPNCTQQGLTLTTPKRISLARIASNDSRASSSARENVPLSQRTRNVTLAFFFVSLFFILSVAPYMVMTTIQSLILVGQTSNCTLKSLFIIAQILFLLHFVTNPVIYLTTCATFRRKLKKDYKELKAQFTSTCCYTWVQKRSSRARGGVPAEKTHTSRIPVIGVTPASVANDQQSASKV